jgi:hypothetical protein
VGDDASVGGDLSVAGDLTVTGAGGSADYTVTDDLVVGDDASVGGDLIVTGATTFGTSVGIVDWTDLQPVMAIANINASYSATDSTVDAYTLTVAQGAFDAGEAISIDFSGEVAGGNAATNVILSIDGTGILTLGLSTTTGEFAGRIFLSQESAASQRIYGMISTDDDGYHQAKYATDTTDFGAGAVAVKLQTQSQNAGDDIQIHSQSWILVP